ncbi:hypothetical protein PIB30_048604 [Stylosanthes scabra]|uniref:AT-hook motif nuclear-localized protein n=1 Tax=Stylosanthes scabra TaxID=79078 RepID=A0ABU6QGG0_9FABA|nr:hypothetical protein [Stylosanthes scabra]
MAETMNNSVSASMPSLLPPKQEQESAMVNMKVETNGAVATNGSLELFENKNKKRGRPRKCDDSNAESWKMTISYLPPPPGFPQPQPHSGFEGRGFATISGGGFTPHSVKVFAGEDVARKIMAFVEKGPRAVFVLSATGEISNVTICLPDNSCRLLTYEGRFEILSLAGSYLIEESGGMRTGGLSVSLASSGGDAIGGRVAGPLIAAGLIQLGLGSFRPHAPRKKYRARGEFRPQAPRSQPVVAAPMAAVYPDTRAATNLASQANPEQSQREFAAAAV